MCMLTRKGWRLSLIKKRKCLGSNRKKKRIWNKYWLRWNRSWFKEARYWKKEKSSKVRHIENTRLS